jgi:hypothetical protein
VAHLDRFSHAHVQLSSPITEKLACRLEIALHKVFRKHHRVTEYDIGRLKVNIIGSTVDKNPCGIFSAPHRQPIRRVGVWLVTVANCNESRKQGVAHLQTNG